MSQSPPARHARRWPDYAAVWRWHFYAGLLCIPFVLWLSVTGGIYLFKPQVEAWLDAPYDRLAVTGERASGEAVASAAIAATGGGKLRAYELPATPHAAIRVLVDKGPDTMRVYVHPQTLAALKVVNEDDRFMNQISFLHGELAIGDGGSMIVEIAACWAIVMILTGLFLWWPRKTSGWGGVLFPRLGSGRRLFWRDMHAVTGAWVSGLALFLLLTGLPWAKNWGGYLKEVRVITGTAEGAQDWTTGRSSEIKARLARNDGDPHAAHDQDAHGSMNHAIPARASIDTFIPVATGLRLATPVLLTPPREEGGPWVVKSDSANRPSRATVQLDAQTGAILGRLDFSQRHPVDQAIGVGIAAHEGQLFGWLNQMISLSAALGLITLSVSAVVLWVRRRPQTTLGAPAEAAQPRFAPALLIIVATLAVLFPLFGASLAVVAAAEHLVLRRIAPVRVWLGLTPA